MGRLTGDDGLPKVVRALRTLGPFRETDAIGLSQRGVRATRGERPVPSVYLAPTGLEEVLRAGRPAGLLRYVDGSAIGVFNARGPAAWWMGEAGAVFDAQLHAEQDDGDGRDGCRFSVGAARIGADWVVALVGGRHRALLLRALGLPAPSAAALTHETFWLGE